MNAKDRKKLRRRKRRIARRLDRRTFPPTPGVVFRSPGIRYEMADRIRATSAGGVGAAHMLARRVGLVRAIDEALHLLKRHAPYHESDHVLNIAYNVLAGNTRLEDLEVLRQDESYMDMLGAIRVPVYDLVSNWAYMVVASLAWTLKAWMGLTLPRAADRSDILRMEFKRFVNAMVRVPCQVVRGARRVTLRLLAYTDRVRFLFASLEATARLGFT